MSKARSLNQNDDYSWLPGYDIKFDKCHSLIQAYGAEGGGNAEDGSFTYTQNLVTFSLCPSGSCKSGTSGCSGGGQYVINMADFVDAYTESKMEAAEFECEQIRENCYCDNANDDEVCENQCYTENGREDCIENDNTGTEEEFEIQRYLECQEVENQNNNNNGNNNWQVYYVGPYCSADGRKIHLGTFVDAGCTYLAPAGTYESLNYYGRSLPYSSSSESLVEHDCISCKEPQDANNQNQNDQQDADEVIQFCEEMYGEDVGKCETNVAAVRYPDTRACEYINKVLPELVKASSKVQTGSSGHQPSVVMAWIFGFTTLALLVYAVYLYQKVNRAKLDLSASDGQVN
jgi:hypothetical protein